MIRRLIALAALLYYAASPAAAQMRQFHAGFAQAKAAWTARRYPEAYALLTKLRDEPYGRRPDVTFMLATAACQTGRVAIGQDMLAGLASGRTLDDDSRRAVVTQLRQCQGGGGGATVIVIQNPPPTRSGGFGKTFFWLDRDTPIASYPAKRIRELDATEVLARLSPRDAPPTNLPRLAAEGCTVEVGRYVVLCSRNAQIAPARLREMAGEADRFIDFLASEYGILPAAEYVTIRLVPDVPTLRSAARTLHGLDVSFASIGYLFADDLSLVIVSSGGSGSILHELMHLALRRNFGDAPQWFEEGLASLYEVSQRCGARFMGVDNWRGDLLRRPGGLDATLSDLIENGWFDPANPGAQAEEDATLGPSMAGEEQRARGEAKLRYLFLYLQGLGRVPAFYAAMRDMTPAMRVAKGGYVQTLQQVSGQSIGRLDEKVGDLPQLLRPKAGGGAAAVTCPG